MTDNTNANWYVTIDGYTWLIDAANTAQVIEDIELAMTKGTVARLALQAKDNGSATVFFNGKLVANVVVDNVGGPKPTEIAG